MRHPLLTELARAIGSSLSRFLAIAGIVALGCGFYAGLSMAGRDMRISADEFYDGTRLYDLRVMTTMGLTDAQVDAVEALPEVEAAMPAFAADIMAELHGERYAMRIMSCDMGAASSATADARGVRVESADDSYLNRLVLAEGTWPARDDECVLSADRVMGEPIRPGDTVEVLYGTAELDGVLAVRTFTVSGLVHSSAFPSSVTLAYTNLGSGLIQQYMYVNPGAFDAELPYTELFVRVAGAAEEFSSSDAYQERVDAAQAAIRSLDLGALRFEEVLGEARDAYGEAEEEYEEGRQEAEDELAEGWDELEEARQKIADAQDEIASGQADYDSGVAALASARQEAERALSSARAELDANQAKADEGKAQLEAGRAELEAQAAELSSQQAAYEEGAAAWAEAKAQLEALADQRDQLVAALAQPDLDEGVRAQLEAQLAGLDAGVSAQGVDPEHIREAIAARDAELEAAAAQLADGAAQIEAARAEIEAKASELASAQAQIDAGRSELASQETRTRRELADAQAELDSAAAQLESAREELAEGQSEYEEGLEQWEEARGEVDAELADAAAQLAEARADIDALEKPDAYILDRTYNVGVSSYQADSERIDRIARVFPLIFFLVAALVALTTMTRMVEDERQEIGTHKALGFSTAQIAGRYAAYAALAGIAGAFLGTLLFSQVLPAVVELAYAIIYNVPATAFPLPIDAPPALAAAALGVGSTLAATWAAVAATLSEPPASLMLPRAPAPGKRILLERIRPLWERMGFSWKVTMRNLFRYKRRAAMTLIGIAGCTALLLTGLGLHDSIWDIIELQFEADEPISRFNAVVGVDAEEGTDAEALSRIEELLATVDPDAPSARFANANRQLASEAHPSPLAVQVRIPDDPDGFTGLFDFRDRRSGSELPFDPDSVILTEKMASELDVSEGDEILVYEQDEVGNATGLPISLRLTDICENYVFHYLYVGADAWEAAAGQAPEPDSLLIRVGGGEEGQDRLASLLSDDADVSTVAFNTETIDAYRKSLRSVNMIVVVLVAAAAALAFIVLFNLNNIQLIERSREIASLKVLGFTRREVAAYIFRETVILAILGALIGLALGTAMEGFVAVTAEVDSVMFGRSIHVPSYLVAFALTIAFTLAVMGISLPKLHAIDMVESLKSVD